MPLTLWVATLALPSVSARQRIQTRFSQRPAASLPLITARHLAALRCLPRVPLAFAGLDGARLPLIGIAGNRGLSTVLTQPSSSLTSSTVTSNYHPRGETPTESSSQWPFLKRFSFIILSTKNICQWNCFPPFRAPDHHQVPENAASRL